MICAYRCVHVCTLHVKWSSDGAHEVLDVRVSETISGGSQCCQWTVFNDPEGKIQ